MINLYRVVDNLISLAENKYEQLNEVYLLTQQQTNAIEDSDMDMLEYLIEKKQDKINLILTFDTQSEAILTDLKTIYDVKDLGELENESSNIGNLNDMIFKVDGLLRQIIQIEEINREKIRQSKDRLEVRMSNAKTGKVAIKQYSGISGYADAVFFDKKIK